MRVLPGAALYSFKAQTFGVLLASLLMQHACGPDAPPDIPDDVVADYLAAVDDCTHKSESAQPVMREARALLEKHYGAITAAIEAQPDGDGPFTYRFDDARIFTAYGRYENYQIYVTMPSGVAFEGQFLPPGTFADPYFPELSASTPLKTGVLGAYAGTSYVLVGSTQDPTIAELETKGGGGSCETEKSSVGFSARQQEIQFFGVTDGRTLPTVLIHDTRYQKATLCRYGSCEEVEGKNVKRFTNLGGTINEGIGPILVPSGLELPILRKN